MVVEVGLAAEVVVAALEQRSYCCWCWVVLKVGQKVHSVTELASTAEDKPHWDIRKVHPVVAVRWVAAVAHWVAVVAHWVAVVRLVLEVHAG